jgi:DeoR family fructose operon transcriptional repressor
MPRSSVQAERRRRVLARVLQSGRPVRTAEMARRLGVCQMTIRRDLAALVDAGAAVRSSGGAVGTGRVTFEFVFGRRHHLQLPEKRRIGTAAAKRIRPGQTVFIDTGTTTLEIARALARQELACTVVTSSLVIAAELWLRPRTELILLGGRVRDGSPDLVGEGTEAGLRRIRADIAFLGADAVDPLGGSFADDRHVARVASLMARRAERVVVVADASKLRRSAARMPAGMAARFARIQEIDELITDRRADPSLVAALQHAGVKVALA